MGDVQSWEELFTRYSAAVFGYLHRMSEDRHLAEDLTSETFYRAMRALDGFRGDSSMKTWLLRIARNLYLDRKKRDERSSSLEDLEERGMVPMAGGADPESQLIRDEESEAAWRALRALPEDDRSILLLSAQEELSCREIAEVLGISVTAVKTRIFRARRRRPYEGKGNARRKAGERAALRVANQTPLFLCGRGRSSFFRLPGGRGDADRWKSCRRSVGRVVSLPSGVAGSRTRGDGGNGPGVHHSRALAHSLPARPTQRGHRKSGDRPVSSVDDVAIGTGARAAAALYRGAGKEATVTVVRLSSPAAASEFYREWKSSTLPRIRVMHFENNLSGADGGPEHSMRTYDRSGKRAYVVWQAGDCVTIIAVPGPMKEARTLAREIEGIVFESFVSGRG